MKGVKKAIVGAIAGVALTLSAIPALAGDLYIGGGASQWQVIYNDVISNEVLCQDQMLIQQTNFMVGSTEILNVNIIETGYVEQTIGEESAALTMSSNYASYEIENLSGETFASTSSVVVTSGDAYGVSEALTQINVEVLP
ncbi:hypothetical protein J7K91_02110 [bacterium]|nr:hypothetical protein [bacterium]